MRTIDFRFVIVHQGADRGQLRALADSPAQLRMDDTAEIKTSLSGSFAPSSDIDWLQDEIRPELILDGTPYPLGVFAPATVSESRSETSVSLQVEAYDRCWRVRDTYTEGILSLAEGTNYITAVKQLLTAAGIATVIETPTSAALSEIREDWDVGTSYLEIINELLSEINYNLCTSTPRARPCLSPSLYLRPKISSTFSTATRSARLCCRQTNGARTSTQRRTFSFVSARTLTKTAY